MGKPQTKKPIGEGALHAPVAPSLVSVLKPTEILVGDNGVAKGLAVSSKHWRSVCQWIATEIVPREVAALDVRFSDWDEEKRETAASAFREQLGLMIRRRLETLEEAYFFNPRARLLADAREDAFALAQTLEAWPVIRAAEMLWPDGVADYNDSALEALVTFSETIAKHGRSAAAVASARFSAGAKKLTSWIDPICARSDMRLMFFDGLMLNLARATAQLVAAAEGGDPKPITDQAGKMATYANALDRVQLLRHSFEVDHALQRARSLASPALEAVCHSVRDEIDVALPWVRSEKTGRNPDLAAAAEGEALDQVRRRVAMLYTLGPAARSIGFSGVRTQVIAAVKMKLERYGEAALAAARQLDGDGLRNAVRVAKVCADMLEDLEFTYEAETLRRRGLNTAA